MTSVVFTPRLGVFPAKGIAAIDTRVLTFTSVFNPLRVALNNL